MSSYLAITGLDNAAFWDDEAQTAITARNFIARGELTGWDGRNLYAYRNGALLDERLNIINPPLDSLVCALSFALFGPSTWSGRILFTVIGLIAFAVFALALRQDFPFDRWHWFFAISLVMLSPVFLLYIRQSRYYALGIFFSLAVFYCYRRSVATGRWPYVILLSVSSILLFYSHFLLCVAFLLSIAVAFTIFHRRSVAVTMGRQFLVAILIFLAGTLPYAIHHRIWHRPDMIQEPLSLQKIVLLWWNIRDLNFINVLPVILLIISIPLLLKHWKTEPNRRVVMEWGVIAFANVVFISLLSPQPVTHTAFADVRYLIASFPLFAALIGFCLGALKKTSTLLSVLGWVLLLTTNLLTYTPGRWEFRWLLPAYLYEIHSAYPTANSAAVEFVTHHAKKDELIFAYPEYLNYPLMFYGGDWVRFCCLLSYDTKLPKDTMRKLNAPLFMEENFPDWIISFGAHEGAKERLRFFSREHIEGGRNIRYRYQLVDILDVYWRQTQRPELPWHAFGPVRDFDKRFEAVYIFRKVTFP